MKKPSEVAKSQLQVVGRAKDMAVRLSWFLITGAAALVVLVAAALIDYWLLLPVGARVAGCALVAALAVAGVGGWVWLRRRPTGLKQAALEVESQRPEVGCVVSTAAEYLSGERRIMREYEPELVAALEQQAARDLMRQEVSFARQLLRPAAWFALAVLVLLLFTVFVPVAFTAFKRTLTPWSGETFTKVEVRPGSVELPVGKDLTITNLFSGLKPKQPALHWREGTNAGWQTAALTVDSNGLYLHTFKTLPAPVTYRVTGHDAISPEYQLTTYVPPEVQALRIRVAYPEYTAVKPFTQETPDIIALRASEIKFRITPTTKLAGARLRFSTLPAIDLSPEPNGQWIGQLTATKDAEYWIELADAQGHKGGNEKPYQLKVLPDKPPQVTIVEPAQDIRADATNTVPLKIAASDDFGVREIKVVYHRLGGEQQTLPCTKTNHENGELIAHAELALAGLNLKPYELVAYHAEALDNNTLDGPGKGASPVFFIEITNEEAGQCKPQPRNGQKVNLLVIQKQIIADTAAASPHAAAEQFEELANRQKEAGEFAEMYRSVMQRVQAPAEATALMDHALDQMKSAQAALSQRKRAEALPPEEKALADLYQMLQLMPELENMPTQPPPPQNAQQQTNDVLQVVLEAIKQQKKENPSNEELARALEEAKRLSRSQAGLNQAMDRHAQTGEASQAPPSEPQPGSGQKGRQGQNGKKAPGEKSPVEPKAEADEQGLQAEQKANAGKAGLEESTEQNGKSGKGGKKGEESQLAQAGKGQGKKNGQPSGQKDQEPGQGQGEQPGQGQGQGRQPGEEAAEQPGAGGEGENLEQLAFTEMELSQEAAALAEKLQRLAGKDRRLGHNAGQKMAQAAAQMAAAAQALRQGQGSTAGIYGGQGRINVDKVAAILEQLLKDQPNLSDVTAEDFPAEYEALISEYLRKLSYEE